MIGSLVIGRWALSSFFTRGGDDGYTGVLGEGRVAKYDPVPEALGTIDEATACLGLARSLCQTEAVREVVIQTQRHLYGLMAEVAATPENADRFRSIGAAEVRWLEEHVEAFSRVTRIPKEFILPGDSTAGAALDVARTVIRRAERRVAGLLHEGRVQNTELLRYLNRLSSLVFVLELVENEAAGEQTSLAKGE